VCIHSHAVYATMFAVAQQDIPSCIDEFTVYLGGDIRCTEYARAARPSWASRR
jgi:L-fuculose-phosphate aldolase